MEENRRLKELKLALYVNHIDRAKDKLEYSTIIKLLDCLAISFGKEEHLEFAKLVQLTIGKCLLRANSKEIVATCKQYFSNNRAASLLGISGSGFYSKYNDLLNRNFENETFFKSLHPMFNSEHGAIMVDSLIHFIENFKYELGDDEHELSNRNRTLELEFLLIYNKLMEIFRNAGLCDKFIFNVCNLFDIDFSAISQLKNNVHLINRTYPNFRYNNRYLMQEIVTLYTYKEVPKGTIGSKVLGRASSYMYNNTNKKFTVIPKEDLDWQYIETLDWDNINRGSIIKFIDIFHTFIRYGI